jgi:hypothetical protein
MPRKHMLAVLNSSSPATDDAVLKEIKHVDRAARERRYQKLVTQMAAHQQGTGPAPTAAEFGQWKEDSAFSLAMGRLLAGMSIPG